MRIHPAEETKGLILAMRSPFKACYHEKDHIDINRGAPHSGGMCS